MQKNLKVLFVSGELIGADVCHKLKEEGCDVKLFIEDESRKDCFDGMVEKVDDWKKELDWVGKEGMIVFDDVGYGKEQDELREKGYLVVGGSKKGDAIEQARDHGQKIFSTCELDIVSASDFKINEAIKFVKHNKGKWVVKQEGHLSYLNYVGVMEDGSDVISVLETYKEIFHIKRVSLQKKIDGIEIGVARYFNGNDWVGPIEFNLEHKSLHNGNIGPKTGEMGTVMWYGSDENNKLFQKTLAKLKPYLAHANFKGDIDVDCIVNGDKVFPIEATARFGCPSTQLQAELHLSPWKDFLLAVAKGEKYDLKYKEGFGVVVSICIPPFPYKGVFENCYIKGAKIIFKEKLTEEEKQSIHFEEVSFDGKDYRIAGSNGFTLYVTGFGKNVEEAREKAYKLVDKIVIPKMFYRTDIGLKFSEEEQEKLKKWGWI
jgi:phosphoribosylamine--glycine ligase